MPDEFVSDADPKFTSDLWQRLCEAAHALCKITTAYHHQSNGQIERCVQTLGLALRSLLGAKYNQDHWETILPHVVFCLNSSRIAAVDITPYEILFGRTAKSFLSNQHLSPPDPDFAARQQSLRQEAWDALQLSLARMKAYFDERRTAPPDIAEGDLVWVRLAKPGHDGYHLSNQTKLSHRKVGPFPVTKVIRPKKRFLVALPPYLKWRPEISVDNLEPVTPDPFDREPEGPGPLRRAGQDKYIIEAILADEMHEDGLKYQVRWLGYRDPTWEPAAILEQDVLALLQAYHHQRRHEAAA